MTTTTHTTAAPVIDLSPSIDLLVDELGILMDRAAGLNENIEALKTAIKAQGAGRYMGSRWQSLVTAPSESQRIDWESVAMHFEPSRQLLTAHTKTVINVPRITTTLQKGKA